MTRKKKAYRPRAVLTDPLALLRPAQPAQRLAVMTRFYTALDMLAHAADPGREEWRDLSDAINTVETLALHMGRLDPAATMPTVNSAITAMVAASVRFNAGLRMGFSGAGLTALRRVVEVYDECASRLTEHEMATAQAITQRRVHAILAGKARTHDVVAL